MSRVWGLRLSKAASSAIGAPNDGVEMRTTVRTRRSVSASAARFSSVRNLLMTRPPMLWVTKWIWLYRLKNPLSRNCWSRRWAISSMVDARERNGDAKPIT